MAEDFAISGNRATDGIYDETFINLQSAINKATKKQAIIAQNIANANNPNFKAKEFDEVLNKAVIRANKDVIIEDEMAALSKNSLEHSAYVKLLTSKISVIKTVTTQGRK